MAITNRFCANSCLGEPWCYDWDCCGKENLEPQEQLVSVEDSEPLKKKAKKELSLLKKEVVKRFASPACTDTMNKLCEGYIPSNTAKNTQWGLRVFQQLREQRVGDQESGECPQNLLENPTAELLNYWLSRFVVEARRADGKEYPSSTIYHLLAALLRYSRSKCRECPNFLDKLDPQFRELRGACESISRQLRQAGVGAEVKHAALITPERRIYCGHLES